MIREQFFSCVQAQAARYEFDGFEPVAMTGGTINHSRIPRTSTLPFAAGSKAAVVNLSADAGLAMVGDTVRYPNLLQGSRGRLSCPWRRGHLRGAQPDLRPQRSYRQAARIPRRSLRPPYVILEHSSIGLTVFARADAAADWTATALTAGEMLHMPEIGAEIPVNEFYEGVDVPTAIEDTAPPPA
jgi:hypothetical protein